VLGTVLAVVVLSVAILTDAQAHVRSRHEHWSLATAQLHLADLRVALASVTRSRGQTATHRGTLQVDIAFDLAVLTHTEQTLSGANQAASLQGMDIGILQTCLGGVQRALGQIGAHNNTAAADDISAVSTACLALQGGSSSGLVYPFDFPDPFVLTVGTTYYAYATNSVAGNIQIINSTDMLHWNAVGNALPSLPAWATPGNTWAPSVVSLGGHYVMYYSAVFARDGQQCISEAVSTQPQGPFVDTSAAPLVCQVFFGGDIDPSPFVDANGTPYLLWKSIGLPGQSEVIWSQPLSPDGTAVTGNPAQILEPGQGWESGIVEAPDLVLNAGRYFLFYSGNNWSTANYAVGIATCTGPLGPCTKPWSQPILASGPGMSGPGGESVFADSSGAPWIAFHAWTPGAVGYPNSRSLYIRPLNLTGAEPVVEPAA
jgi:beta-xylosidase